MVLLLILINVALATVALYGTYWPGRRSGLRYRPGPTSDIPTPGAADRPGTAHSKPGLLRALHEAHSDDPQVAAGAAWQIAKHPDQGTPALVSMLALLGSTRPTTRLAAAAAVRAILHRRPDLVGLCWPDPNPLARRAVIGSISGEGPSDVRSATPGASPIDIVEQALGDPDPGVRRLACGRLTALERDRAVRLAVVAMDDEDEEVRRVACGAIGALGDRSTVELLVVRLSVARDRDAPMLLQSVALVGRRYPETLEHMAQAGDTPGARAAAIRAIGAAGFPSWSTIAPMVQDDSRVVRRAAAGAMADIARASSGPAPVEAIRLLLLQLGREQSASVTLGIIDTLEACRATAGLDVLLQLLPVMNPAVRERAVETIAVLQRLQYPGSRATGRGHAAEA